MINKLRCEEKVGVAGSYNEPKALTFEDMTIDAELIQEVISEPIRLCTAALIISFDAGAMGMCKETC